MGVKIQDATRKIIKFQLRTPTEPEDMPLSPPYRFLVILLRRGFLEDYTTLDELLHGHHFRIKIKDEALEKPIFLKSVPGGRSLDPNHGLSRHSLSHSI
jgi:hypothetical protein